jgi:hypothetical protein
MRERAPRPAALAPAALVVLALVVLALGAVLAACGTVTQSPGPSAAPSAAPSGAPSLGPSGAPSGVPGEPTALRAYFGLGSTSGNRILAPVERALPTTTDTESMAKAAMAALLAGPVEAELSASPAMFTVIPPDTAMSSLQLGAGGAVTVDLNEAFLEPDDLPALRTALAQVVVTLTQFPEITGVNVTIEGAVLEQTDAEGQQLAAPATRADYADALGPIFVDAPAWGATLHSPFRLAGLADVFEATFRFRLLGADGRSLAEGQLMASCGTGCLGTFGVDVPFTIPASTAARLQVFDLSEQDGSVQDLVDYPVTLLP